MGKGDTGGGFSGDPGDDSGREPTTDERLVRLQLNSNMLGAEEAELARLRASINEVRALREVTRNDVYADLHALADPKSEAEWLEMGTVSEHYALILNRVFGETTVDVVLLQAVLTTLCPDSDTAEQTTSYKVEMILREWHNLFTDEVSSDIKSVKSADTPTIESFISLANVERPLCVVCEIPKKFAGNLRTAVCEGCGGLSTKNEKGEWAGPNATNS